MTDVAQTYEEDRVEPELTVDAPADKGATGPVLVRPVPRISIHAFYESPDVASTLNTAAEDRRLARAHVMAAPGGITAAIAHFSETPTPNLIVVETHVGGEDLFDQLMQLAQVCDSGTKVIIIGHSNDIALYRELMRQGVSEYLVAPLSPLQMIDAISTLYVDPSAPPIGHTIAFTGARGGVGASTIAHNIAWCIGAQLSEDVTIVDFDLPFGTAGLDFNQDPTQGVADALAAPERLDDVLLDRLLVSCGEHLSLFAAPSSLDRDYDIDPTAFESVVDVVRATVPWMVLDVPHVWSAWSRQVLMNADDVVITATPDLASLRNTKNLIDLLKAARPNDRPPMVVLNQVGVAKRPEIPVKDFGEAIGAPPALVLGFDAPLFGNAANNGQMVGEIAANSRAANDFAAFARQLTGRDAVKTESGLLAPLLSRLKLGSKG